MLGGQRGLKLQQCLGGWIPVGSLATDQCVRVELCQSGEIALPDIAALKVLAYTGDSVAYHAAHKNTSICGNQAIFHTGMGFSAVRRRAMASVDEKREILRRFIQERRGERLENGNKFNIGSWAKAAAVNANSIYNFLNGHSEGLDPRTYAKLARAAGVQTWQLSGETPELPSPTTVWVAGHVEAGAFRAAVEWDRTEWYAVDVPVPARFRGKAKALEVRGPSMNNVYPAGTVVIWVDMLDFRAPRDGDKVIVFSYCHADDIEATVKVYRQVNGEEWLWPDSSDPAHQQPINPRMPPERVRDVEVQGIVIGSYRAEVH